MATMDETLSLIVEIKALVEEILLSEILAEEEKFLLVEAVDYGINAQDT